MKHLTSKVRKGRSKKNDKKTLNDRRGQTRAPDKNSDTPRHVGLSGPSRLKFPPGGGGQRRGTSKWVVGLEVLKKSSGGKPTPAPSQQIVKKPADNKRSVKTSKPQKEKMTYVGSEQRQGRGVGGIKRNGRSARDRNAIEGREGSHSSKEGKMDPNGLLGHIFTKKKGAVKP